MTDQQRIGQLERDNSQLKQALKQLLDRTVIGRDLQDGIARMRKHAQEQLKEADLLEELIPLLEDTK